VTKRKLIFTGYYIKSTDEKRRTVSISESRKDTKLDLCIEITKKKIRLNRRYFLPLHTEENFFKERGRKK
jgi:hypothetical protein